MDTMKLIQLAQEGDKNAKEQLVNDNMGLVYSIVKRFANRGHETDDLCQIGAIGLVKAIDKFDFNFEVKFSTYAVPLITGEIKRFFRDDGMIKVSRSLKDAALKAKVAAEQLAAALGRTPTIHEISEETQISTENIIMALEAVSEVESLNKTIYSGDGNPIYLMDKIEEGKDAQSELVNRLTIHEIMESLDEKERQIIYLRYFKEKTQSEIANLLGISQVQVSRMEKKILLRMREELV
jgi:RNA polymerase sporulation-specific sigma factor